MGLKKAEKVALAALVPIAIFFVGGMIAIIAMGQGSGDLNPLKIPEYFWYYRSNGYVMRWLLIGMGGATVLAGGAVAIVLFRKPSLHGDARWAKESEIKDDGLRADAGILLGRKGGRPLRFGGTEHVFLEAPTRAGKGVGIVIPNLIDWPDSVVVLDVKQENWDLTAGWRASQGHKVLLFDPLDPSGKTARYNPLSYINRRDEVEVINELQKIAAMLFPPPASGDSFWADSARTAFIGVGAYVAATAIGEDEGRPFTIGEIYRNLTVGNPKSRFPKLIAERANSGVPLSGPCVSALNDFCSSSDNTFTSIRQSVTARIGLWINPYIDAATSESDFDFRDFRRKRVSLYLGVTPDNLERVSDLYNLLFQQLVDLNVRSLPSKETGFLKLLLLLDEFPRLGRASVLAAGFSYVAGYNIRMLPVVQSRSQLHAVYGKHVAEEIITNCGVEVVFTPKEGGLSEEVSRRLGTFTIKGKSTTQKEFGGMGRTVNVSDQRRDLLMAQEVRLFPRSDLILFKGGIPPIRGKKIMYYMEKHFAEKTKIPAPKLEPRAIDQAEIAKNAAAIITAELNLEEITDEQAADETVSVDLLPNPALADALPAEPDSGALASLVDELVIV